MSKVRRDIFNMSRRKSIYNQRSDRNNSARQSGRFVFDDSCSICMDEFVNG